MYSKEVMDHYENPRNVGSLDKDAANVGTGLVGAPACLHGDTLIALVGDAPQPIKNLVGREILVYSYNEDLGIEIKHAYNIRKTREDVEIYKVILDDDSELLITGDHLIRTRGRIYDKWVKVEDLQTDKSIMPFYKVVRRGYWTTYVNKIMPNGEIRKPEHRMIYEFHHGNIESGYQIHHKDHDKKNNSIQNLEKLNGADHMIEHNAFRFKAGYRPQGRNIRGDNNPMVKWWGAASKQEKSRYKNNMSIATSMENNGRWLNVTNDELLKHGKEIIDICGKLTKPLWIVRAKIHNLPQNLSTRFKKFSYFKEAAKNYNHKIKSIQKCGYSDVYCLTVNDNHNFAIVTSNSDNHQSGIIVHNCGDVMKLQIKVNDAGIIEEAKFKTFGCGSAIAASSLMTEWIKGKTLEEASQITNANIADELSLPPVKIHCSVLAQDAIEAAIKDYKNKQINSRL